MAFEAAIAGIVFLIVSVLLSVFSKDMFGPLFDVLEVLLLPFKLINKIT
tara:strand:+ start:155 stop:301 length:147 start_codon:yes stop_codon:yes gene_type:complete